MGVLVGVTAVWIDADASGGTTAGGLIGRDPISSAPATRAVSTAAAARRTSNGRPEDRRERRTGPLTGVTLATGPSSAARVPIASQRSGVFTPSSDANRRRRSSIAVSQEVSKATAPAGQVGAHGQAVAAKAIRDLADRQVRVVEEDDRRALSVG